MLTQVWELIKNALTWWIVVVPWEQGVRVRLGKHRKLLGPGVHMRIPLVDKVFIQSTRTRYSSIPSQTLTTLDRKVVTISGLIAYGIVDLETLYNTLDHGEVAVESMAQGVISEAVGNTYLSHLDVAEVHKLLLDMDLSRYGLSVVDASITDVVCPPKTYRLITGPLGREFFSTDQLDTQTETAP